MRALVRSLHLDPDPTQLPGDPADFAFAARLYVGAADGPGEESFDVWVCSPEWLLKECARVGHVDGRHKVIVAMDAYSEQALRSFLTRRVENISGQTWDEVAQKVSRLGRWEFEDYSD